MAVAPFAVGAGLAIGASDTLTLDQPAGTLTGKKLVAFIGTFDEGAGVPVGVASGWTLVTEGAASTIRGSIFWAPFDGTGGVGAGPYNFGFDVPGTLQGVIIAVDGTLANGDIIGAFGAAGSGGATTTIDAPGFTPSGNDQGVFWFGVSYIFLSGAQTASGYSGTDPTFSEVFDAGIDDGNMRLHIAFGVQATAAPTGDRTATASATVDICLGMMFSLKPATVSLQTAGYGGTRQMLPLER